MKSIEKRLVEAEKRINWLLEHHARLCEAMAFIVKTQDIQREVLENILKTQGKIFSMLNEQRQVTDNLPRARSAEKVGYFA